MSFEEQIDVLSKAAVTDMSDQIPGAMQEYLKRELEDGTLLEFEKAPVGWLTKDGNPRKRDWRAYHITPPGGKRQRVPSVTTLLDAICPKGGLPTWAEARGIEGAIEAVKRGAIDVSDPYQVADAVEIVRSLNLGADAARDQAASRGLNVHDLLRIYMETGEPPNPADHPMQHRGFIRAMVRWLLKTSPEPVAIEQLICHTRLGYAGRLDLRARIGGLLTTVDFKTQENAGIYLAAHAQVNLYERAAVECGDEPASHKLVVVFAANGEFDEMPADHPEAFTDAALRWLEYGRPVDLACASRNQREKKARAA